MIATLTGTLFAKHPDRAIIDVGGVGYEVLISARTYDQLPAGGDEVFLFVYTNVREDAITLFGFAHPEEKELFPPTFYILHFAFFCSTAFCVPRPLSAIAS